MRKKVVSCLAFIVSIIALSVCFAGCTPKSKEKEIAGLDIVGSIKSTYYIGEDLDLNNAKLKIVYTDNTNTQIDLLASMVTGFNSQEAGSFTLTITYKDKTITKNYSVAQKVITGIELVGQVKTTYIIGEDLDLNGAKLKVLYNNNSEVETNIVSSMVTGFSTETTGNFTLTITYEGFSLRRNYTVSKHVSEISLVGTIRTLYATNEALDTNGAKLKVVYADNTSEEIDILHSMVTGFDTSSVGTRYLVITYLGSTITQSYEVIEADNYAGNYVVDYDYGYDHNYVVKEGNAEAGKHNEKCSLITNEDGQTYKHSIYLTLEKSSFVIEMKSINQTTGAISGSAKMRGTLVKDGLKLTSTAVFGSILGGNIDESVNTTDKQRVIFTINKDYLELTFDIIAKQKEIESEDFVFRFNQVEIPAYVGEYTVDRTYGRDAYSKSNGSFVKQENASLDWYDEEDQNNYSDYWTLELDQDNNFTLTFTTITNNDESTKNVYVFTGNLAYQNNVLTSTSRTVTQNGSYSYTTNYLMTFTVEGNTIWFRYYDSSTENASNSYTLYKFVRNA